MPTYDIGTGQTYTTISAWETARDVSRSADEIGLCLAELFNENVTIDGGTCNGYWMKLMGKSGSRHDGRAYEVSSTACARIYRSANTNVITVNDPGVEIAWLDIRGPGNYAGWAAVLRLGDFTEDGDFRLHHCIIHNNVESTNGSSAAVGMGDDSQSTNYRIYRNIVYGWAGAGILPYRLSGALNFHVYHNTCALCGQQIGETDAGGIQNSMTSNNAYFENNVSVGCLVIDYWGLGYGNWDNNASEDTTGDSTGGPAHNVDLRNLTPTDLFQSYTSTYTSIDLRTKSGSPLIAMGDATYSTSDFPEIDIPITGGAAISGTWDVGADQYSSGASTITESVENTATQSATADLGTIQTESSSPEEQQQAAIVTTGTIAESSAITDSSAATTGSMAATGESVVISDACSALVSSPVDCTESTSSGESSSATTTATHQVTESATPSEEQAATAVFSASVVESVSASHTDTADEGQTSAAVEEAAAAGGAESAVAMFEATVVETAFAADYQSTGVILFAESNESASIADTLLATGAMVAAVVESTAPEDGSTAAAALIAAVVEITAATDSQFESTAEVSSVSESVSIADNQSATVSHAALVAESAYADDTLLAVSVQYAFSVAEVAASESSGSTGNFCVHVEEVALSGDTQAIGDPAASLVEAVSAGEQQTAVVVYASFEGHVENVLYDWLVPILDMWREARDTFETPRATGQVVFVWHMENAPRPATPLLEGRITAIVKIGRDSISSPDHDGTTKISGTREYMLYLTCFGNGAIDNLLKIRDACEDPNRISVLFEAGTTPVEASEPLDAHAYLDTMPEDRATMDIRFRTTTEWMTTGEMPIEDFLATGGIVADGVIDSLELEVTEAQT